MSERLYFAYGSNMIKPHMACRCPNAAPLGLAELHDFSFALDEVGYATVLPCPGETVIGLLWSLGAGDETFLDGYEGVSSGCYRKSEVVVETAAGAVSALVYVSLRGDNYGDRRPGYMENNVKAAVEIGLPEKYTDMLRSFI